MIYTIKARVKSLGIYVASQPNIKGKVVFSLVDFIENDNKIKYGIAFEKKNNSISINEEALQFQIKEDLFNFISNHIHDMFELDLDIISKNTEEKSNEQNGKVNSLISVTVLN